MHCSSIILLDSISLILISIINSDLARWPSWPFHEISGDDGVLRHPQCDCTAEIYRMTKDRLRPAVCCRVSCLGESLIMMVGSYCRSYEL